MVKEQGGQEAIEEKNKQAKIKLDIENLLEQLRAENNPIKSMILSNKIKMMYLELSDTDNQNFNIQTLLDSIALEKKRYKRY